ncbi:MAG: L-dopachrome tautomerase-related protein [bacterium]
MKTKNLVTVALVAAVLASSLVGCGRLANLKRSLEGKPGETSSPTRTPQTRAARTSPGLEEVAVSDRLWTGVAVSRGGRIFVSFPRWSEDVTISVGELASDGTVRPFPDDQWNTWTPPEDPARHFVCVQSVYVDDDDALWVLDPASAYLRGVVAGGAKLVKIDLGKNSVAQVIAFDETAAPVESYLNDVRIDTEHNTAYITDSGLGALVVVDLATGKARRVLAESPTTKAENVVLKIAGKEWKVNGQTPRVNADGLALDPTGRYLYYQALSARSLYRIESRYLRDPGLGERDLDAKVESLGTTGAADGIEFGPDGYLYLTGIEESAIKVFASLGQSDVVIKDKLLVWPDSFARTAAYMYVTTSQLNLGEDRKGPCRLFRFKVAK